MDNSYPYCSSCDVIHEIKQHRCRLGGVLTAGILRARVLDMWLVGLRRVELAKLINLAASWLKGKVVVESPGLALLA